MLSLLLTVTMLNAQAVNYGASDTSPSRQPWIQLGRWTAVPTSPAVQAIHHEHSGLFALCRDCQRRKRGARQSHCPGYPYQGKSTARPKEGERVTAGRGRFVRRPRGIGRPAFPGLVHDSH
ncbi:hypothetical protein BO94DRAFT_393373 [Aspergillus sclerotioniger CBS 115572]|uniref:Secreted protein n=1 Tax=Aspergillus sclerotioniger CBS 115572 TaxID=1450535 RepID=A0A317X1L0_9EURO|nr:hypothetical protein BO94DRAFT_393373 [Aspergillus sclerotioniger CBS 115572]PWY91437.1 hypothetical protein BO94DRAFT_393373 [Aspergillus sclerotioniger CBS 115572]